MKNGVNDEKLILTPVRLPALLVFARPADNIREDEKLMVLRYIDIIVRSFTRVYPALHNLVTYQKLH